MFIVLCKGRNNRLPKSVAGVTGAPAACAWVALFSVQNRAVVARSCCENTYICCEAMPEDMQLVVAGGDAVSARTTQASLSNPAASDANIGALIIILHRVFQESIDSTRTVRGVRLVFTMDFRSPCTFDNPVRTGLYYWSHDTHRPSARI